ncbi:carbohydrate ABC transporter permease [Sinorhizobium americanum]|uniref:Various polyols ABC transporter, permease component 1 n=1 Tax=Sinorhizobium americanum TaxID=194963 RepID=A0A1L3LSJ7_9HYPH|nr:sugar ABC transporter permease [Sinorhizobium americanum]APG93060.1 various polyols ABC transporter, permease component 1 [Sinorhizobium americanum]OAP35895.1 sugar ABC transporter permease [Sinorhizobium americanum]
MLLSPKNPALARPVVAEDEPLINTTPLMAPSVVLLFIWMIVPLAMTLWFSVQRYNLLDPTSVGFAWFDNYEFLLTDPALLNAIKNTIALVVGVLAATVVFGVACAVALDAQFPGRGIARLFCIIPFFVMPTVSALVWKNLLMNPVNGLFSWVLKSVGLPAIDWFSNYPLSSIGIIVAWQWIPFATLILLTSLQSLDREQIEAARMDGARGWTLFWNITLPHLYRSITIVVMIETIFLLSVFAEILVTTSGGPGEASTTLPFLIYKTALLDYDVGGASAGGVIAIILANIVAFFLVRTIAHNLER